MTEQELQEWILNKLSVNRPEFAGMPACPFALKAFTDKQVQLEKPPVDMISVCELLEHNEVVVYWFDPSIYSANELTVMCKNINSSYPHIVALEDHPAEPEQVAGVTLNQGTWALILIQHKHKLDTARKKLKQSGYYDLWDPDYLDDVLGY